MNISKIGPNISYQNNFSGTRNTTNISFSANSNKSEETPAEERSLTSKKWGVGIASFGMTGLGQFINGQVGRGFAFLGTNIGLGLLSVLLSHKSKGLSTLASISALGVHIYGIVDAVKNVKPDQEDY